MESIVCFVFGFLVQCGGGAGAPVVAPTPTPIVEQVAPTAVPATPAPTATAVPPTATPRPAVKSLNLPPTTEAVELVTGPAAGNMVALTFDAGAGARNTLPILDALKAAGLRVTLFLTGQWAEENPELVKRMVADGHEFANHSYSHPEFTKLTPASMISQMSRTEDIIKGLTGKSTKPWFRPPFGDRDARVLRTIGEQGYYSVYWTLDSGDWREDYTAADVLNTVTNRSRAGSIVVNHLDSWQTAQVLPQTIARLQAKGLRIVTMTELFSE